MRLHELSITAFGPFVDTVHVDFDELAASGLFLLTGDTGSGKTSVLDAVCFALYGEVPGDRHSARHLRSDHADPWAEPRVVLRVSIGARTFRFTRSPAWDRPKRRGTGTTRVQAHVVVEEHRGGEWVSLTNRLDEAGQLVTGLLGMTCTQFTQVAMLPQGRFQAFLRATSPERHAVLQRLFRTRRFEEVERWLVERRVALRRRSQDCHDRSAAVVSRIQEAAGVGLPAEWDPHDLEQVADDGELSGWARRLCRARRDRGGHPWRRAVERHRAARALPDRLRPGQAARRGTGSRRTRPELAGGARRDHRHRDRRSASRSTPTAGPHPCSRPRCVPRTQRKPRRETESAASLHVSEVAKLLDLGAGEVRPAALAEAATRANEARAVAESWLPTGTRPARRARPRSPRSRHSWRGSSSRSPPTRRSEQRTTQALQRLQPELLDGR